MFFSNILHLARASDFAAGPFRALEHVCRAPRPRAHARPPRGGDTRAVCLTPGYRAWQTYGLHHSAAKAAEPPSKPTGCPQRNPHR